MIRDRERNEYEQELYSDGLTRDEVEEALHDFDEARANRDDRHEERDDYREAMAEPLYWGGVDL